MRILRNWDGDDRRLAMTPIALTQFAGVEVTAFVMAAVGTDEVIRPAQIEQGLEAFVFVAITFQEGIEAEVFLELDRISFHGMYSFLINYLDWFYYTTKHAYN